MHELYVSSVAAASRSFGRKDTSIGLRAFYWLIMKRIV